MARLLGQDALPETLLQRMCVLAVLHDAGKTSQGFQNRAFGERPTAGHVSSMVGLLATNEKRQALARHLDLQQMVPWFDPPNAILSWLQTTWSHHGHPVSPEVPDKGIWTPRAHERLSAVGDWAREWYPGAFDGVAPALPAPRVQHLFNGALTLADWIGSDTDLFPMRPRCTDAGAAYDQAQDRARGAIRKLNLTPTRELDTALSTILGGHEPYDIQTAIQELPVHPKGTLTVVESATGSGKTEGALGRFAHLLAEGLVDSMYFALPTRSAATQLHDRVKGVRDRMFGEEGPPVHLAVPGYLRADDAEGTRFGWSVRWDEDIGQRGWAAESSKRYMASPIAVGTIDQVLLSVLRTKHAHLRAAGLARSFLVVDEVHASSVYMNELLQRVLSVHKSMGGHALLMSATLGSSARAVFTGAEAPDFDDASTQPYPRVSHVNGPAPIDPIDADAPGDDKTVSIELVGQMENAASVAQRAQAAAENGACVLVIRNTVAACQDVFEELDDTYALRVPADIGEKNATRMPHHSRYCAADRNQLDGAIEHFFGKHEEETPEGTRIVRKEEKGIIAVATQTVEQSLDIDADLLITDLCPMDVLLQRIGRLHRHNRDTRPEGYDTPQCVVLTPEDRDLTGSLSESSGRGYPGPGLGSVYGDLRIIEATWRALEDRIDNGNTIDIPSDNRTLVEEATHPSIIDGIEAEGVWATHAQRVRELARSETLEARNNLVDHGERFTSDANQFPERRLKTRLGDEGIVVDLPTAVTTPLDNTVHELTLSPYLFDERPDNGTAREATDTSNGFTFAFAGVDFTYTRLGIQQA